jgi:pyruvate dehydrogenase E1 component alpha subunit
MYDPDLYRDKAEVELWKERDPLRLFTEWCASEGLVDEAASRALDAQAVEAVDAAVEFAERGTPEPTEDLTRFVTSEGP